MARKGLNLIPEALVDIAGVLTADPGNSQARTELGILVEIQRMAGRRSLEPEQILAASFPHAYGSTSNPPVRNLSDPHQMSLSFFYKVYPDEVPTIAAINPGVVPSGCIACKVIKDKKDLKTCQKVLTLVVLIFCILRLYSVAARNTAMSSVRELIGIYLFFRCQMHRKHFPSFEAESQTHLQSRQRKGDNDESRTKYPKQTIF
jgi:hypothetical protein